MAGAIVALTKCCDSGVFRHGNRAIAALAG
jgi:hypothetical protein